MFTRRLEVLVLVGPPGLAAELRHVGFGGPPAVCSPGK